jgi:myosin protein heavy chain
MSRFVTETQVRPLLAATRNDEELLKKEAELQLIKERAEWDKREREALENLKMALETEKRKVEDELEGERALGLDKDALLERSKRREGELEEEVAALQADLDTLDSQLDRALKIQRESEEKHETLRMAFDQAADHLVRLESQQRQWVGRETELTNLVAAAQQEMDALQGDKEELQKVSEELTNLVSQREQDLSRTKERMEATIFELETKLNHELRNRWVIPSSFALRLLWTIIGMSPRINLQALNRMLVMQRSNSRRWHAQLPSIPP